MTAHTTSTLYCDRDTRPAVDGIRTVCGLEFGPAGMDADRLRFIARQYGWAFSGVGDFCPAHKTQTGQNAREDTA